MRKKLSRIMVAIMVFTSVFSLGVQAKEINSSNVLYPETQAAIDEVLDEYGFDEYYFENIINLYNQNDNISQAELNAALMEAVDEIKISCSWNEIDYQNALNEYQATVANSNEAPTSRSANYYAALALYSAGMTIVRGVGCEHTAESMNYAIVPEDKVGTGWAPANYYYDHDSWGTFLSRTEDFFNTVYVQFEDEVLFSNKNIATVSGTHAFTQANSSLDAYTQLHNVYYSVTFVKESSGGYSASFLISDVYDFDPGKFENIAVNFANDYCVLMQNSGYIAPFNIYIVGDM